MKLNAKHKKMRENKALAWDEQTKDLSFVLHPTIRKSGQLREHYLCGHHINFPSRDCHESERAEMIEKGLV